MRMFIMSAIGLGILTMGYALKTNFPGASSISDPMVGSNTLSPHEIHLRYHDIQSLPVHDIPAP
jgi:hypothetical protein